MDAKPQRPRGLSRIRDENIPPSNVGPMKTLHQRTKSTSALSSFIKNGIKANPQRRTAFADVSNTVRTGISAQDDMVLSEKGTYDAFPSKTTLQPLKEIPDNDQQQSKQPSLLRPAQRPLSAIIQKSLPAAPVNTVASAVPRHTVTEPSCEVANIRRVLSKKQTQIFKEPLVCDSNSALPSLDSRISSSAAPVRQILEPSKEKPQPAIPEDLIPAVPAKDNAVPEEPKDFSNDLIESINQTIAKSENLDVHDQLDKQLPLPPLSSLATVPEKIEPVEVRSSDDEYLSALETQLPPLDPVIAEVKAPHSATTEVQEYWEEEDEEYYDAEGYTTARSIRSKGDNTTGGLTTIVEPRVTARVLKELDEAREFVQANRTDEDIEDEAWDTSMVAEYGDEIFEYMRKLENKMRPNEHYMDNQTEIQWSMRAVLMDWLIQVHARFQLLPETLFLAVNYVDRFLSCKVVSLGKLQLVGATAIFVAAKYEEINCPSVQEIVYMVDNGYTIDEILKAERFMLSMLQFELGWPGPMSFLRRISKADEYDLETRTLAKYLLEVMIMDERFVACAPSFAAAGAHCLARMLLKKGDWGLAHIHYSQYTWSQLYDLVAKIVECCQNPQKHHLAVYEKYTEKKYKRASLYVEAEIANGFKVPPRVPARESSSWQSSFWRR